MSIFSAFISFASCLLSLFTLFLTLSPRFYHLSAFANRTASLFYQFCSSESSADQQTPPFDEFRRPAHSANSAVRKAPPTIKQHCSANSDDQAVPTFYKLRRLASSDILPTSLFCQLPRPTSSAVRPAQPTCQFRRFADFAVLPVLQHTSRIIALKYFMLALFQFYLAPTKYLSFICFDLYVVSTILGKTPPH